ncbi:HAD family hydrolase [Paenibacillus sp. P96]|uniref:HAD family hydrolase n=1 Tax=Paenibacillus zeirhizosphaerae TaxID=2987519 RepID=A0ABT9FM60_9BACL|nr:HAD family hydrolase [Paenibacillus sp. P96]MDP4095811.1 HAD family hydrolase [Paenibacillus sp. P96]
MTAVLQLNSYEVEVDAILFDKDGTLLQFLPLWGTWAGVMTSLMVGSIQALGKGVDFTPESLLGVELDGMSRVTGYDLQGPLAIASIPEIEGALAWQLYTRGMSWNQAVQRVREIRAAADAEVERERPVVPLPGLMAFLSRCMEADIPLAVVTADQTAEAVKHLEWLGVADRFGVIMGRDQVINGKPSPEIVFKTCELLGVLPARTVLIGDTAGDMQTGRLAGVSLTMGIGAGETLAQADVMIRSYDELRIGQSVHEQQSVRQKG